MNFKNKFMKLLKTIIVFFSLYLFVLKNGLSVLYRVLSFRKKSIHLLNSDVSRVVLEASALNAFTTKFLLTFLGGRAVVDSFFKLSEAYLSRSFSKQNDLRTVRSDFVIHALDPRLIGSKQALLPLSSQYSVIKLA